MSRGWPNVEVRGEGDRWEVGLVWQGLRPGRFSVMAVCLTEVDARWVAEGLRMRVGWERGYVMDPATDRPRMTVVWEAGEAVGFGTFP